MVGRILVPLDGSPAAEAIVPHVARIATRGTLVTFLLVENASQPIKHNTVVETGIRSATGTLGGIVVLPDREILRSEEDRSQAIDAIQDKGLSYLAAVGKPFVEDGIKTEYHATVADDVVQTIVDFASSNAYDMIAMATHAREGLSRLVSGSVTGKVLELAPMPVLVVRTHGA